MSSLERLGRSMPDAGIAYVEQIPLVTRDTDGDRQHDLTRSVGG